MCRTGIFLRSLCMVQTHSKAYTIHSTTLNSSPVASPSSSGTRSAFGPSLLTICPLSIAGPHYYLHRTPVFSATPYNHPLFYRSSTNGFTQKPRCDIIFPSLRRAHSYDPVCSFLSQPLYGSSDLIWPHGANFTTLWTPSYARKGNRVGGGFVVTGLRTGKAVPIVLTPHRGDVLRSLILVMLRY